MRVSTGKCDFGLYLHGRIPSETMEDTTVSHKKWHFCFRQQLRCFSVDLSIFYTLLFTWLDNVISEHISRPKSYSKHWWTLAASGNRRNRLERSGTAHYAMTRCCWITAMTYYQCKKWTFLNTACKYIFQVTHRVTRIKYCDDSLQNVQVYAV